MTKLIGFKNFSILSNPWVYFFFFLVSNTLLSFSDLPLNTKPWVVLIGLVLPFLVALAVLARSPGSQLPLYQQEFLPSIPAWIWFGLAGLAIFARFYKLTTLSVWPHGDEGTYIYFALDILRKGVDRLQYSYVQLPFFYPWLLSLTFKLGGASLAGLWFWPAFFSMVSLPLIYAAARQFFSRSFSFICVLLAAFCFWFLYVGRFSEASSLFPFAEAWVFFWMGKLFQEAPLEKRFRAAVILGFSLGLTFYVIYLSWVSMVLMVVLTVFWKTRRSPKLAAVFTLSFIIVFLPMGIHAVKGGVPHYVNYLFNINPYIALSYIKIIFWGLPLTFYSYQPVWGGFLNPILGSLCFLGILELILNIRKGIYLWLFLAFGLFLLPGILSRDSEAFRILSMLGVVIPLMALGMVRLLLSLPSKRVVAGLLILFIPSAGADFYHLAGPYHRLWDSPEYWTNCVKSISSYRASLILKEKSGADGPGLVFSDFTPNNS